ncbi:hypothetical protein BDV28DRAFT_146568 [Aspergillus coremiiformis]|uniref:Methyltransferase n=1 Tax=Aspergillus coremiiformis TaxID=138285 RepID=A0A5N6ZBD8_9EURO|nr:hypothetical protein BDV28DRAFT_146568 [Aspergillus coremiiformis]
MADKVFPRPVDTTLHYCSSDTYPQGEITLGTLGSFIREYDVKPVTIHDVRGQEDRFTLDTHGFQFVHHEKTVEILKQVRSPVDPLAVADARSFPDEDLFEVVARAADLGDNQYTTTAETQFPVLYGKYRPGHKWYYLSDMNPNEVLFIKCYDSQDDGTTARRCPHSAFVDPRTQDVADVRESIELRGLVFYGNGSLD